MTNNIYRSAALAQNYLPERRSAAFRHHYSPGFGLNEALIKQLIIVTKINSTAKLFSQCLHNLAAKNVLHMQLCYATNYFTDNFLLHYYFFCFDFTVLDAPATFAYDKVYDFGYGYELVTLVGLNTRVRVGIVRAEVMQQPRTQRRVELRQELQKGTAVLPDARRVVYILP